jgi:hypothetical protein
LQSVLEDAVDHVGDGLEAGHFLPEEAPDQTTGHLLKFLAQDRSP